jgi:ABC-type transport system substrate-binding protein
MPYYADMTCGAFLRHVVIRSYTSAAALLAAAVNHEVDLVIDLMGTQLPAFQQSEYAYRVHVDPATRFEVMDLNVDPTYAGRPNPLHDVRVRLALALALDKVRLIRGVLPVSEHAAQQLVAWTPWINTPRLTWPYTDRSIRGQWDPIVKRYVTGTGEGGALADARKLLAETPWKSGFSLDLYTTSGIPTRDAEVASATADWARIGVKVNAHFAPGGQLFADWEHGGILQHGLFQVGLLSNGGFAGPDWMATSLGSKYVDREHTQHNESYGNFSGVHDPAIDRAFEAAESTFDHGIRARSFATVQREINQRAYWITLWFRVDIWTDDGRIQHVTFVPAYEGVLSNSYAWRARA